MIINPDEIPLSVLEGSLTRRPKRKKIRRYVNNWKPQHTNVVYLHLEGKDEDEIMELTGYSRMAIWNILRTPEAEQIKNAVHSRIIRKGMEGLPEKVAAIQFQALENISEFIADKDLKAKNPFAFYDRSVKAAELANTMAKQPSAAPSALPGATNNTQINNFIITPEQTLALTSGLDKAIEVAQQHLEVTSGSVGHLSSLKKNG